VDLRRFARLLVAGSVIAIAVTPVFAAPVRACSCAVPSDIQSWVDESEAAFVGTLIEKVGDDFAGEALYVFAVEEWVKGDLGEVIEVHSAANGAACGFEFWDPDQRIGAVIHEEGGELHGGLCSQIDPDVLLAAMRGPAPSATGLGHLLVGNGWSSTRLTVLDDTGAHVADISPPGLEQDAGTQQLEVCPGGDLMLQLTPMEITVWELESLDVIAAHDLSGLDQTGWVEDISCRTADASSIYVLVSNDLHSRLLEVGPEMKTLTDLDGIAGEIGNEFVITQTDHEGDATWVDITTGEEIVLTETPTNDLRSISVATHPTERLIALVETDFNEDRPVEATLSIVDETGTRVEEFIIPWETYSPTWLDESRVAVKAHDFDDWEQSFGFVFDLSTGEGFEVEGWDAEHTVADGDRLYGVNGGTILTTDLSTVTVETLVTLASQSAGPIVLLDHAQRIAPTTTVVAEPEGAVPPTTIPPLVAPESGRDVPGTGDAVRWIAGGSILGFLALLVWLARRPSGHNEA
jgi:hypothetical protein